MSEFNNLGARLKISIIINNKACRPIRKTVVYTHIYGNKNHVGLCLQGSGGLRMCGSQNGLEYSSNLFLDDGRLVFYQAFGVDLSFKRCGMLVEGLSVYYRYCAPQRINTISL